MKKWLLIVLAVVVLAALWLVDQWRQAEMVPEVEVEMPDSDATPEPRYPLPEPEPLPQPAPEAVAEAEPTAEVEPPEPLPELDESDPAVLEALIGLLGEPFVQRWVVPELVVQRTVVIAHSLDGPAPQMHLRPLAALPGTPKASEEINDDEPLFWNPEDAERYASLVATMRAVSPSEAAAQYQRHYPLFQEAWSEVGEAEPYFNDRLVDIIDHLLGTPEVELPVAVMPFEDRLHFDDEALEDQSWGRKLLIRMGPEQAEEIKQWLSEFREEITGQPAQLQEAGSRPDLEQGA